MPKSSGNRKSAVESGGSAGGGFVDLLSRRPAIVVLALVVAGLTVVVVLLFLRTRRLEDHAKQLREDVRGLPSDDDIATMVHAELRRTDVSPPSRHVRFNVSSPPPPSPPELEPEPDLEPESEPKTEPLDGDREEFRLVPDGAELELERAASIPVPSGADVSSPVWRSMTGDDDDRGE